MQNSTLEVLQALFIGLGHVGLTQEQISELEHQASKLEPEAREVLVEWLDDQR